MLYRALHGSGISFETMIQDLSLPYDTVHEFVEYASQKLEIWPLWLCPLRATSPPTFHPYTTRPKQDGLPQPMLNIGLWGEAGKNIDDFVRQNRDLEKHLKELNGRKVLYSHTYYTEQEFWQLYDQEWYRALRERYSATTLPTVYDKVKVDVTRLTQSRNMSWVRRLAS